ncbi:MULTISPECIES: hypothetical protein [unclassified Mycobacterium]|uniref:hypothetical protein n=1 Tax=unclassified Mycobacterium TaxID=2642494 RepID=UPI0012E9331A|nr:MULTISPECIES: hypothetical protein [unclassified Mycobacterium]
MAMVPSEALRSAHLLRNDIGLTAALQQFSFGIASLRSDVSLQRPAQWGGVTGWKAF